VFFSFTFRIDYKGKICSGGSDGGRRRRRRRRSGLPGYYIRYCVPRLK
jgi:hypothetical protein